MMDTQTLIKLSLTCIGKAFRKSLSYKIPEHEKVNLRVLSKNFLGHLTAEFSEVLPENEYYKVLSLGLDKKDYLFQRKEYLFDLVVGEVDKLPSSVWNADLPYFKKLIIALESEFAPDNRQSLIDFNKLTISKADLKIMILPLSEKGKEKEHYVDPLSKLLHGDADTYLMVFLPYPDKWQRGIPMRFKYYKFTSGRIESFDEIEITK